MTSKAEILYELKKMISKFDEYIDDVDKIWNYTICPDCNGDGEIQTRIAVDDYRTDLCDYCNGEGIIKKTNEVTNEKM